MIRYASKEDKLDIKKIWDSCFELDNNGYNEFFFNNLYRPEDTYIISNDKEIMSTGSRSKHVYMINNKPLKGSLIYGLATSKEYRNNGFMTKILNTMLDQIQYQELVTFIQSDKPELYKPYGFEPIYYKVKYTIEKNKNTIYDTSGCRTNVSCNDLLALYIEVMKRFNGYMIRDLHYYELYLQEIKAQKGDIIAIYDNGKITGYMSIIKKGQEVTIEECIYLDAKALVILLSFALKIGNTVYLNLTKYENVDTLFNHSNKEIYPHTLMRINDYNLFNKLFQLDIHNTKEAMDSFKKPLFIREHI